MEKAALIQAKLRRLEKREQRLIRPRPDPAMERMLKTAESKIPASLREKLEAAFYHGFRIVFEKGARFTENTAAHEKMRTAHNRSDLAFECQRTRKALGNIGKDAAYNSLKGLGLAALEGAGLGLLGIGLPDIPLFLSVLLRGVYDTAAGYGFLYDTGEEQRYILLLIETALSSRGEKASLNARLDRMAYGFLRREASPEVLPLEEQMRRTAHALSSELLLLKFIQGLPLIGAAGGIGNAAYFRKVQSFAALKYEKRYLLSKC